MLTLAAVLPAGLYASTPQDASRPVTGDWNFVLTPLDANGIAGTSGLAPFWDGLQLL